MDRETKIMTSWYGARKTAGVGLVNAAGSKSSASSRESMKQSDMASSGRIASALSNVLRNGMAKSATSQRLPRPNKFVRDI